MKFFYETNDGNYLKKFYFRKLLFSFQPNRKKSFYGFICLYMKWNFLNEIRKMTTEKEKAFYYAPVIEKYDEKVWNWHEWKIYNSNTDKFSFWNSVWDRDDFFRFLNAKERLIWELKYLKNLKNSKILLRLKSLNYKEIDNLSYRIGKKLKCYLLKKYEGVIFF